MRDGIGCQFRSNQHGIVDKRGQVPVSEFCSYESAHVPENVEVGVELCSGKANHARVIPTARVPKVVQIEDPLLVFAG